MTTPLPAWHPRRWLIAGGVAGFAAGALDLAWSWEQLTRFLPSTGAKLLALLHLGLVYAVCGALVGFATHAVAIGLLRWTDWGSLWGRLRALYCDDGVMQARARLLAYLLLLVVLLAAGLVGAYFIGLETILHRRHKGLIIAVAMAATLGLSLGAIVVAISLGRPLTALVTRISRARFGAILLHWSAPLVLVLLLAGGAAGAVVAASHETLSQLHLRPLVVVLGALALSPLTAWLAARILGLGTVQRMCSRATARSRWLPIISAALAVFALAAAALATGSNDAVRKATAAYSGLGGPLSRLMRRSVDLDGDGYSAVLGGGDCDDFDSSVHPGAPEIPDDGIDQNCIGGDVKLDRQPHDVGFAALPPSIPRNANVMLISIDAVRADHLGAYGYTRPTSPNLDRLAGESTLFVNAWAHAPSTRYAIPSILTGRHPSQVLWDNSVWWPALQPDNLTIAEAMKPRGLTTAAILNHTYFSRVRRMDQGFDIYDNRNASLHRGRDPADTRGSSSRQQADAVIAQLTTLRDQRFYLWVHFYDPHYRYERHPGTQSFGDGRVDIYDHEIRFTDHHIGRVLDHLRTLGIYGRTIIAVTGDHGEGFGERGIMLHGYHLYTPQTKIPLFIRVPGVPARRVLTPVGHIDLLPTLANLVEAKPDERMLGRSLVPMMLGHESTDADRQIFQEVTFEGPTERRSVVTRKWQLIYNVRPDNTFELYSLADDPQQTRDLWGQVPVPQLKEDLLRWIDALGVNPDAARELQRALRKQHPKPSMPLEAQFGDAVRLLGIDLSASRTRPGDEIELTWHFEALASLPQGWRIFVHIEGPTRFLADHEPVSGLHPFAQWREGQFIADKQRITIPRSARAGTYTIHMGLFRGSERLPLRTDPTHDAGDNRLRAATFRVR